MDTRRYDEMLSQLEQAKYPDQEAIKTLHAEMESARVGMEIVVIRGKVTLTFDQRVESVGFTPEQAREIAGKMIQAANLIAPLKQQRHRHKGKVKHE